MVVTELHISNFRGIGRIDQECHNRLNVFIGNNGSGKSSLLRSLTILLSWFIARMRNVNGNGQLIGLDDIKLGTGGCDLACRLDVCPEGWNVYRNAQGAPNDERRQSNLRALMEYVRFQQRAMQADAGFNIPLVVHYPVTRSVLDIPLRIRGRHNFTPLAAYDDALYEGTANFRLFFEWFREREDLENEHYRNARVAGGEGVEDRQLAAVRSALQAFFPQLSGWHIRRNPLAMLVGKDGEWLKINQLSDGEKCFIALVADLARRFAIANPSLANPLEGSGVVMIDEVDLHLHPKWQMMVIPRLLETFPNAQFFITTHSPAVISHVKPESLFLLQRPADGAGGVSLRTVQLSYGQTFDMVYKALMGLHYTRPQLIAERFSHLYTLLSDNRIAEAKEMAKDLKAELVEDPEILKIEGLIRRKELIGK